MARIGVKICGLSTPETVNAALRAGADHVGFMFFPRSPRYVNFDQVAALAALIPDHVGRVGVFVDPDEELLRQAMSAGRLSGIQLHGHETPERVAAIRSAHDAEIWKVVSVKIRADLDAAASYVGAADRILFDAKTPDGAALPGGMGVRFDWTMLRDFRTPLPWALSGGLDPDNVGEAVAISGALLVDVSSGVESAPGVKDVDKIAAFCKAVSLL